VSLPVPPSARDGIAELLENESSPPKPLKSINFALEAAYVWDVTVAIVVRTLWAAERSS